MPKERRPKAATARTQHAHTDDTTRPGGQGVGTVEGFTPTWASQHIAFMLLKAPSRPSRLPNAKRKETKSSCWTLGMHTQMILQDQGARVWAPWKVPRPHGPASHAASMLLRLPTRPSRPPNLPKERRPASDTGYTRHAHKDNGTGSEGQDLRTVEGSTPTWASQSRSSQPSSQGRSRAEQKNSYMAHLRVRANRLLRRRASAGPSSPSPAYAGHGKRQ